MDQPTPVVPPQPIPPTITAPVAKSVNPLLYIAGGILLLGLGGLGGFFLANKQILLPTPKACTMEAKLCPDGTSVGRSGPNCEFAPCPTAAPDPTANWKTLSNTQFGFEFKYPNQLVSEDSNPETQSSFSLSGNLIPNNPSSKFIMTVGYTWGISMNGNFQESVKSCSSDSECFDLYYKDITQFPRNNIKILSTQILGKTVKGFQFTDTNQSIRYFPISRNGKFFLISFTFVNYSQEEITTAQNIIDQILSTFKFIEPTSQNDNNLTKEECIQQGGVWKQWGQLSQEYCQIPASDGGKSCTDGSQCSLGNCITINGTVPGECQTYKATFGCITYIKNGSVDKNNEVCID